ncbi:hypothetical protein MtrunA17_Chr6g0449131 [Medicago truncatula]|uniref:Uncharacterized protein n=1 Tax=Medicago truncatula TaxID=3880 RepID=A0A396HD03_MEDTR|nr:hypothetical protein MtrunA17_Chr6g0449131 [Medicago truncatula]
MQPCGVESLFRVNHNFFSTNKCLLSEVKRAETMPLWLPQKSKPQAVYLLSWC